MPTPVNTAQSFYGSKPPTAPQAIGQLPQSPQGIFNQRFSGNYTVPIPRNNPVADFYVNPAGHAVEGQPGAQDRNVADFSRLQSYKTLGNAGQKMFRGMPMLQQSQTPGSLESALGLGQRQQQLGRERNLQAQNEFISTVPVESQMDRSILASQVGTAHADLLRQMQDLQQRHGLAQQGQRFGAAQAAMNAFGW